jgi:hypothetical protein
MIDNVTITLKDFSGNFDNCRKKPKRKPLIKSLEPEKDVENSDFYELKGGSENNPYYLKIWQSKKTEKVFVQGSLRKWAIANYCLHDLTYSMFVDAIKNLAEKLNICFDELTNGRITRCEIGQSVSTKYPIPEIINSLAMHGQLKNAKNLRYETTIYFKNKGREKMKQIKVYDKTAEVASKGKPAHKKMVEFLKRKGISMLRIETTLYNKKSFEGEKILKEAFGIRPKIDITVGDITLNYPVLYEYWANEVNNFVVFSAIDENKEIPKRDRSIVKELKELGAEKSLEELIEERQNLLVREDYKSDASFRNARSKIRKKYEEMVEKFHSTETYRKNLLKLDATRHLKRKNNRNEKFPYSDILKTYWESKK